MENLELFNPESSDLKLRFKPKFLAKKFGHLITSAVFLIIFLYIVFFSAPLEFPKNSITNIAPGSSLRSVSLKLKDLHVIRSRVAFETFVIIYNGEKNIVQGDYLFDKKIPVFSVAKRISKGKYNTAPIKVTIPEGYDVEEISKLFKSKLVNFDEHKFIEKAKDLEGYLFPDTYFFLSTDDENSVLKYLNNNFYKKIDLLKEDIEAFGESEINIIIMASLIEREASGDEDRALISGILWRRLSIGMALQVDAAPETYKTRGLPEDPICNPGLEAIIAAIHPEASSYLYYLHDKDGNIHFAKNFEEHKLNKSKYLK